MSEKAQGDILPQYSQFTVNCAESQSPSTLTVWVPANKQKTNNNSNIKTIFTVPSKPTQPIITSDVSVNMLYDN